MTSLVCLGDSLTEGADIETQFTWAALVANMLPMYVINKGIGGDTSAGLLSRFYPDVTDQQADMVLILGGTNDLWWDLEVNLVLANLFSIACQAQYHNIAPIIGTPLPFHTGLLESSDQSAPVGGYEKCLQKLTDLVQRLADSAAQYDIPCIDYHQLLCDDQGQANAKYYLEDGLHLNKQGHRLMAQETVRCLKKVFCFF